MADLKWYLNRLKKMGPREVAWRLSTLVRDQGRRVRYAVTGKIGPQIDLSTARFYPQFSLVRQIQADAADHRKVPEYSRLHEQARLHLEDTIEIFVSKVSIREPDDWHRDFSNNVLAERRLSIDVDYRNVGRNGDCKLVWEPSRHHQLVRLGLVASLSGEEEYAVKVREILSHWLDANPYGLGMQWRSPLELGVRLINWVWAFDLIRSFNVLNNDQQHRLLHAVYLHVHDISSNYSRGSSANNHLIGEAAGVYVATCYFPDLPGSLRLREQAKHILENEVINQSYEDGCTKEHAVGYECFVLQFYLFSAWAGLVTGDRFSSRFRGRVDKMIHFLETLESCGSLCMFGDQDDGYVLDLGSSPYDAQVYRELFNAVFHETTPGSGASLPAQLVPVSRIHQQPLVSPLDNHSTIFAASGYAVLKSDSDNRRVAVLMDLAPLGFGSIAAHGHADALATAVWLDGHEVLVDSGTYDYFSYPDWRNYFRSTSAHNCVEIDGEDQSVMSGPFMWDRRAEVAVDELNIGEGSSGGVIRARHDGYVRLADPVVHSRSLILAPDASLLTFIDKISCREQHNVAIFFHVAETWTVTLEDGVIELASNEDRIELAFDAALTASILAGAEPVSPGPGWRSKGYHQLTPINSVVLRAEVAGDTEFRTELRFGAARS